MGRFLTLAEPTNVLVTGSTGNLGQKAVDALSKQGDVRLTRIGRNSGGCPDVVPADLLDANGAWRQHFEGIDVVLHLAADPKPVATWESVRALNIDLSLNVIDAARAAKVKRFVFASSNWILGGYRFSDTPLRSDTPPQPTNAYGASKFFIERLGMHLAETGLLSFLSLRIGYCQPGTNRPNPRMAFGRWGQEMWLSNEDWAQAVRCACLNRFQGGAVLNIMSDNKGMRWDLDEARSTIGYVPRSRSVPKIGIVNGMKDFGARLRDLIVPQMSEFPVFGARW